MTLRNRHPDTHGHYRALISQRLDERLTTEDARALRAHLLTCARCRAADRDYRAQRTLLQGSAPAVPPRDLWARTSAALDREVSRGGSGVSREPFELPRRGTPRAAIASLVGLIVVVAVVGNQLGNDTANVVTPPGLTGRVAPTPFEVPTQELAYVGNDSGGLAIYRTKVSMVCPERAIDCASVLAGDRQVIRLSHKDNVKPRSVAFHPQHDKVAIAASDGRGESVYVVLLKPVPHSLDADETDAPRLPTGSPPATAMVSLAPTDARPPTGATATDAAATTATGPVATAPGSSVDPTPRPTATEPSGTTRPGKSSRPGSSDPTAPAATDAPSPRATEPPSVAPATDQPTASVATPSGELLADIQPILQDVHPTGAEPAWSPDGETLAFSAMPADRSHGPDIYIWQTGAAQAKRLTNDHRSYFASWAGDRIVASRAARPEAEGENREPGLQVSTVVIDLATREQRRIRVRGLWLPVVDASERFAVVWRGDLREVGPALEPVAGALYLVDWNRLDPFRAAAGPVSRVGEGARPRNLDTLATATPVAERTAPASASDKPSASASSKPAGGTRMSGPRRTRVPGSTPTTAPAASPDPTRPPTPTTRPPTPTTRPPDPTIRPTPTEDPTAGAQAIEPGRDARLEPVLDWQVRWNTDGDAYGFWIAETPGASWGRLVVVAVDRATGRISRDATLLGPTLARRTFTVGNDRVAWVAPVDDAPDGELRVRTWGPNGNGTVRIRNLDGEGVPGF